MHEAHLVNYHLPKVPPPNTIIFGLRVSTRWNVSHGNEGWATLQRGHCTHLSSQGHQQPPVAKSGRQLSTAILPGNTQKSLPHPPPPASPPGEIQMAQQAWVEAWVGVALPSWSLP